MSTLDLVLFFGGILAEAVAVGLLLFRRSHRNLPVFSFFLIWSIVSDSVMLLVGRHYAVQDPQYTQIYMVEISLDFCVQFAVLVELAWSVLRPIRNALPRQSILVISILLLGVGAVAWPIAGKLTLAGPTHQWHILMQLQTTFSILRVLFVFILAGFSQLLAIGWRDRELQIATGLGFYSLMTLGASILHTHHLSVSLYHDVDQIVTVSYFCSLLYWVLSFAQQEAPRQEFAPGMQSFLLAVSGAARSDRMTLEQARKSRKQDK